MNISRKKLAMVIGIPILLLVLAIGGWWTADYLALFKDDVLDEGPVVVDEQVVADKPSTVNYKVERVLGDLEIPWDIAFTSESRWLITERTGAVRVIENGKLIEEPLVSFPDVSTIDEEGLMGLVLHPDYGDRNTLVYACYAAPKEDVLVARVVRFSDLGDTTSTPDVIVDDIPAAKYHAGCRLAFGPDGFLYISTGDATDKDIAQDPESLGGKILRVHSDGQPAADNIARDSRVWSLGHRNPQGLAFQPNTGALFATEHGPTIRDGPAGGDEINYIEKGGNYGWPIVSHEESAEGYRDPLLVFTPAVAPAGATFYTGEVFPQFTNDMFFATLAGEGIIRVVFDPDDPTKIAQYENLEDIDVGRIRDVAEGPDGYIYFMTSNTDGRGDPRDGDDSLYRLVPDINN